MGQFDYLMTGAQPVQLPDPVKMAGNMLSLANAARQGQLAQYTLQKAQRDDANAQALQQAIPGLDPSDPASVQAAMQRFPQAAQGIAAYVQNAKKAAAETGFKEAETKKQTADANAALVGVLGGQAYALSQKPDLSANDIRAFYGAAQKLGVDPSVIGAPSDPSSPDAWRQTFGNFANLSRKATDQIKQAGDAATRAETARHNTATEAQATNALAQTTAYQNAQTQNNKQRLGIEAAQADPLGLLGINPGMSGQSAPSAGGLPAVPAPGTGTVQGPNGPVVTPQAQAQRNQGRLAILTQERDDQLRTTGKVDPALMAEIDATTKGIQSGNPFAAGQASNPQPPSFAGTSQAPQAAPSVRDAMAQNLHGDDFLKSVPPAAADTIKALAEGRMAFPSSYAMRTPYWQSMMAAVAQYDPSFDTTNYGARAKMAADWGDQGPIGKSNLAINTVIGHLGDLKKSADALNNTASPLLNKVVNSFQSNVLGDPRYTAFAANAGAVAKELERAYRGTGGSQADIDQMKGELDSANSPDQINAVIQKYVSLLQSKIDANANQYRQTMGHEPPPLLGPHAQTTVSALGKQAQANTPALPKEGDVQSGYVYRGGDPADPKSWLKVGS